MEKKDQWWRSLVLGDYQQIEVKDGEWHYTKRNADFTPLLVGNLINLLSFGAGSENLAAKQNLQAAIRAADPLSGERRLREALEPHRGPPGRRRIPPQLWVASNDNP